MALAPLASTSDLSDRGVIDGDTSLALNVASALVREAAACPISQQTSTVAVTGTRANLLGLPGPVVSVASVTIDGTTVDPAEYEVLPNGLWRHCGWGKGNRPQSVTVAYTYGLATVPVDIVDLTCSLAKAWLDHQASGGGSVAGLANARIDDAGEGYTSEFSGQVSPVFIPEATRQWLARRFGGSAVVLETL